MAADDRYVTPSITVQVTPIGSSSTSGSGATATAGFYRIFTPVALPNFALLGY
jgi:hypothetical protein